MSRPRDASSTMHESQGYGREPRVTISTRLKHVTWANYTLPMSTGGLALLLHATPYQFNGLQTIGKIIYIFDLVLFVAICAGLVYRFSADRGSLGRSLSHPTESLFFPTFLLAFVNVLNCAAVYGLPACGDWLVVTLRVLFWIYTAVAFLSSVIQYWVLFTGGQRLTIQSMTPAWILPAFGAMLVGTLASVLSASQPPNHRISIIIAGITMQGYGWCTSLLMYALFLNKLMQYGLPAPNLRPGMFIAVGPPSFTALALIQMSNNLPEDYGYFALHPTAPEVLRIMAVFIAIFLWMLSLWFFSIALISVVAGARKMSFHLAWWSVVFPNVGFTISTADIGRSLESPGILGVATAMTIILFCLWLIVLVCEIVAIWRKEMMMPGMDEDKDQYRLDDEKHGIGIASSNT